MFLNARSRYNQDGTQVTSGPYLWVVHGPRTAWEEATAFVRSVTLRSLGNFMAGKIRVGGHYAMLSGAYGSDGLPSDVPQHVYEAGIRIPGELLEAWRNGGGHNGPGREAHSIRDWALSNLPALRKAGRNLPSNHRERLARVVAPSSTAHPLSDLRDRILDPINPAAYAWPFEEYQKLQAGREQIFLDRIVEDALALGFTETQIAAHPWRAATHVHSMWTEMDHRKR